MQLKLANHLACDLEGCSFVFGSLGMARAFGEALVIQMVVGNSAVIPTSLTTPVATLTSVLTMGIGNTVKEPLDNNVLGHWP